MHREQFGRREIGDRIAVIISDLIIRADFLEQPEYPLRAAVVQMVDDQAHGLSFGSGPIGAVAVDQRRELADQLGAENGGDPADVAAGMESEERRGGKEVVSTGRSWWWPYL